MHPGKEHTLTLVQYKSLFDTLYAPLCVFANKYLNDLEVSKDIVQDVFIKIWEDKISYLNENAVKSFLYTLVRNKSLDYLKSRQYKVTDHYPAAEIEKLETEAFFLSEVLFIETATIVENAIRTLPDKCAQIIRLGIREYTNAEIAKELDISINTVKTQKKIAYQKLRNSLSHLISFFIVF